MKTIITIAITLIILTQTSCTPAGTLEQLNPNTNSDIEVYAYFYKDGQYVYVSRFKSCPNVQTTTWTERNGKSTTTRGNIVIYENDSIQIIRKK